MMLNQAANLRRKETEKEKGGGGRIRKEGRKGERDGGREGGRKEEKEGNKERNGIKRELLLVHPYSNDKADQDTSLTGLRKNEHHQCNGHELRQTPGDGGDREAWHAAVHEVTESDMTG